MGSRYGRNKRRKAREEIARLGKEVERVEEHNSHLRDSIEDWDHRIIAALGQTTAYRRVIQKQASQYPLQQLAVYEPLRFMPHGDDYLTPLSMEGMTKRLYRFVCKVEEHPDQFRRAIKIIETNERGHAVAICVSEEAIRKLGFTKADVNWFSDRIAEQLCRGAN